MSKRRYAKPDIQTDKTDLEFLKHLTADETKTLNEELNEFRIDYTPQEIESFMCAILWATISSKHDCMKQGRFIRRNITHFVSRTAILLKAIFPQTDNKSAKLKK